MSGIAVVASAQDAEFADDVRAGLRSAGLDAAVSPALPQDDGTTTVLIWSAALEATHSIDAQALISLWSEDRLVTVRRDAAPLPLGLRDLPSLPPESSAEHVCREVLAGVSTLAGTQSKQLGRYDLTAVLDKGAMGIVYEGMDPKLHRKVAVRAIRKDLGEGRDPDRMKRFMREAQAVARLNHPHIVQVYDFGEEGDVAYIVMEFIKGKELKNFFDANERFELKEAVRIMCELLDALDFAHESGIVHRDIKPANVMLDSQAMVKLGGFASSILTGLAGQVPAYMTPEQISGGSIDRRSDIFSAGIILYQFLTGEKPFTGSGAWTIAKKIIQDHPPVPSSINNTISPLFDNVVNKALAKTVEQRYQTAKEFAAALKRALEGKSDKDESDRTVVGSMADMSSLARPAATVAGARADATGRTGSTGSQEVELEFWRAIKEGNDPDDFELYVQQFPTGIYAALAKRKIAKLRGGAPAVPEEEKRELEEAARREAEARQRVADEKAKLEAQLAAKEAESAKREKGARARRDTEILAARPESEPKKKLSEAPREKTRLGVTASVLFLIAALAGSAWYYFSTASFERQAILTAALEQAAKAAEELRIAQAQQLAALKKLEEEHAAESAAIKAGDQAKFKEAQEAVKRAEIEVAKQTELIKAREAAAADARKKAMESAEMAKKMSQAAEPMKSEIVAVAPAPIAKAPEPAAKAPEAAAKAPEPVAKSVEAPKAKTRSEREREEEDRLARQIALKKSPQVAASAPSASSSPAASELPPQTEELLQQARAMEASDPRGAVKIYRSLARNGNAAAARRLGEIYEKGIPGIARDYAESLQWYGVARKLGEILIAGARTEPAPAAQPTPPPAPPVVAAIPEAAKSETQKPAAVESAPLVSEPPKPAPAPVAKPAPISETVKKADPAPAPVAAAAPEAPKAAAPAPAPAPVPEEKPGWFSTRGIWIALLVLALVAWRRYRRRQKKAARREQQSLDAAKAPIAPSVQRRAAPAPSTARQGNGTLFVSYSHKDRPRVEPIVTVIEEMGRRVWMDRSDITGKTGWAGQIVRAIRECHAVVLMASPNSYSSDQVVRELYLAMNHKKTIVPIEIEPAEMPDELQYILAPFHHHRLSGGEPRQVIGRALAAV